MDILIICNCATGLQSFREMLIQELIKKGNRVRAIVPLVHDAKEKMKEQQIKKIGCSLMHIPIERRGMNPFNDLKLFFAYCTVLNKYKPDCVITYTIKPNIYGGLASRIAKITYAVNITGLGTAFQNDGILKKMITMMYKISLKKAKVVFFENIENKVNFINANIVENKKACVLAGAGVDLKHYAVSEYPPITDEIRFLFIGRIMKEKGINELFEVILRLRKEGFNCTLHVLGGFDENYLDQINEYEKEGWLHYHGFQNDVRPYIVKSHCFVLPSWHEGMANTNLECAASGRPIITSNIHGCMESVINGKSGLLCESANSDSLYKVMKHFMKLPFEEKKQMGIIGRKHMENMFDKKKVVEMTIDALMK